jgi:type I restriction enzyme S subunit
MAVEPVGVIAPWLHLWLRQLDLARLSDGSNVPQINHGDVEPLEVPLPPLPEQHRIVAEVERRLSVVDELEATVEKNLARCSRLRQSILKMAFEGRLVPQDPNDEPASALLERIRREIQPTGIVTRPKRQAVAAAPRSATSLKGGRDPRRGRTSKEADGQ